MLTLMEGALRNQKNGGASTWRGLLTSAETLVGVPSAKPGSQAGRSSNNGSHTDENRWQRRANSSANSIPPASAPPKATNSTVSTGASFLFKISEPHSQHMHRIHASPSDLSSLVSTISAKIGLPADAGEAEAPGGSRLVLRYDDDEGDRVVIGTDEELAEACTIAAQSGKDRLVLHASYERPAALAPLTERNGRSSSTVGKTAARLIRGMSEQERVMGAGAILAGLVVGLGALARR